MTKQSRPKRNILTYLPTALGLITVLLTVAAAISMLATGVLPWLYTIISIIFASTGLWLVVRPLFKETTSRRKRIVLSITSVSISVVSIGIISFSLSFLGFLYGIQTSAQGTETYSVIAKKGRSITMDIASSGGLIQTDPYFKEAKTEFAKHTKAKIQERPALYAILRNLDDTTLDTAALNTATLQLAKDSQDHFDNTYEVIATFTIKTAAAKTKEVASDKPFAIYISGIDTYGAVGTVSRSDVNILAVINPTRNRVLLINTPRDYYIQLHGTTGTKDKLTHAGLYGVDMSRKTLEDLYGIEIPYYIRVNFSSLIGIVNAVGGVDVYSPYEFKSFVIGHNHLNGQQALEFSRERYSFSEGDNQRGRNQQLVVEALISKLSSPSVLVNYGSILSAVQDAIETNVPSSLTKKLINRQLSDTKSWHTSSISVNGTDSSGPTYSMGDQPLYVMIPDETSVQKARQEISLITQN